MSPPSQSHMAFPVLRYWITPNTIHPTRNSPVTRKLIRTAVGRPCLVHSAPLVLGTPTTRGSTPATRSARATALNCASTMWCGLRP